MDNYKDHVIALCKRKDLQYRDLLEMVLEFTNSELDILDKEEGVDNNTESSNDNNDTIKTKGTIYSFLSSIGIEYLTIDGRKVKLDQFGPHGITHIRSIEGIVIRDTNNYNIALSEHSYNKIVKYINNIKKYDIVMNNDNNDKFRLHYIPNTNCVIFVKGYKDPSIHITNIIYRNNKEKIYSGFVAHNSSIQSICIALKTKKNKYPTAINIPFLVDKDGFISENPIVNEMIAYTNG